MRASSATLLLVACLVAVPAASAGGHLGVCTTGAKVGPIYYEAPSAPNPTVLLSLNPNNAGFASTPAEFNAKCAA